VVGTALLIQQQWRDNDAIESQELERFRRPSSHLKLICIRSYPR